MDRDSRASIMSGVEAWDRVMAHAASLRARDNNPDPVAGRDLLTYLAQILLPTDDTLGFGLIATPEEITADKTSLNLLVSSAQSPVSTQLSKKVPKKRKRKQVSHFFASPAAEGDLVPKDASIINRIQGQKEPAGQSGTTSSPAESHAAAPHRNAGNEEKAPTEGSWNFEPSAPCSVTASQPTNGEAFHGTNVEALSFRPLTQTPKRTSKSHYFDTPKAVTPGRSRPPRGTVSGLPFPTLEATQFGLIQEQLADDPYRLLIAITFLVRTPGKTALPVYRDVIAKYSTPQVLASADTSELIAMIKHLGLSAVRAAAIQKYAKIWAETPPRPDVRFGVKNYPDLGDGADVRMGEELPGEDQDPRTAAWEIGHMTQGRYAIDSWRIFCRDVLLGRARDWKGKGREGEFQPEWMRVLPTDKELRAYLRWMWMREGWAWDPLTGDREVLSETMRTAVNEGRVAWNNQGDLEIVENDRHGPGEEQKRLSNL